MTHPSTMSFHRAMRWLYACVIVFVFFLPFTLPAQVPSPLPDTYVNDLAGVLSREEVADLNQQIQVLEKKYSVQFAVVLVKKLPDGMEIEDYALGIGRKWHACINDSGLVYVASIGQKKQRLEVARNLEGILPDITAHEITDHVKPFFRSKDYAGGLRGMIAEIGSHLGDVQAVTGAGQGDVQAQPGQGNVPVGPVQQVEIPVQDHGWPFFSIVLALTGLFFIVVIGLIFRGVRRPSGYTSRSNFIDNSLYINNPDYGTGYGPSDGASPPIMDTGSNSGSSDFGNWGGGGDSGSSSSDPGFSSSDSGFSGGGSTNDW